MKKRLVALTLVAAMALGMTACGSKSNNKDDAPGRGYAYGYMVCYSTLLLQ